MMRRSKLIWFNRIVFYATLIAGCFLAFAPANQSLHAQFNDKLLHAVGFFCLALSAHLAHPRARVYWPVFGLAIFGILIEVIQAYLPYRSFSWWDWIADLFGIAIYFAVVAPLVIRPLFKRYRYGPY